MQTRYGPSAREVVQEGKDEFVVMEGMEWLDEIEKRINIIKADRYRSEDEIRAAKERLVDDAALLVKVVRGLIGAAEELFMFSDLIDSQDALMIWLACKADIERFKRGEVVEES